MSESDKPVNVYVNVSQAAPQPTPIVMQSQAGCLVQALWFLLVGWWAGSLVITLAYLLLLLIITIPLGIGLLNNVPYVMALRRPTKMLIGGQEVKIPQHNFLLRTLWFLLIGFWFTAIWLSLAYLFCLTILGLPVGFWMFDRTPAVLTLRRSSVL